MKRITITINLGNDAMQTPYDVVGVLSDLSYRLTTTSKLNTGAVFQLIDLNGNHVGRCEVTDRDVSDT